jgi:hypothetical protein
VALSPGGCIGYRRTFDGARLATEVVTLSGEVISEFVYTGQGSSGRQDRDLDGFFDWEVTLTRGSDPEIEVEIRELDPDGAGVVRRERRTINDATVHVIIEHDEEIVNQFDAPAEQVAGPGVTQELPTAGPCEAVPLARYVGHLIRCVDRTTKCLEKHGRGDLAAEMWRIGAKAQIQCIDDPGSDYYARAGTWSELGMGEQVPVTINMPRYDPSAEDFQLSTMCHELMHHTSLGAHDPALKGTMRESDADAVNACTALCGGFSLAGLKPTKCQCATCTGRDVCDPLCKSYRDCNPEMGAVCPCPQRHRWFPTYTECVEECPSGVSCFGYGKCLDLDKNCP